MSQVTLIKVNSYAPGTVVQTLTGDTGGPISPDASNNIDILGGTNINTAGAGNAITINLDANIVVDSLETSTAATALRLVDNEINAIGSDAAIDIALNPKGVGAVVIDNGLALTGSAASTVGGGSFTVTTSAGSVVINSGLTVDSSGRMTNAAQPAFAAYLGSSDLNVTGNGTAYTLGSVTALTEIFDRGNNFNTNGTFTAPVSGIYQLSAAFLVQQASTATDIDFRITTTKRTWLGYQLNPSAVSVSGSIGFNMTVLADMDAGDTATVGITASGVGADTCDVFGGATNPRTWFSGHLVC